MLRVSSLGLIHYHGTARSLLYRFPRHSSTTAHKETLVAGDHQDNIPREENLYNANTREGPSSAYPGTSSAQTTASAEASQGRRRPTIPPLLFKKKRRTDANKSSIGSITSEKNKDHSLSSNTLITHPDLHLHEPESRMSEGIETISPPRIPQSGDRKALQNILACTDSATEAWDAYEALMSLPRLGKTPPIPYAHLHRLARLLASTKPRTRALFLRLLSVLSTLYAAGGHVHVWEWNALVDCAGKGWRKTRIEDLKTALDIFEDMVSQRGPGATFKRDEFAPPLRGPVTDREVVKPDIVTYTTLLGIAGRTLQETTLRHVKSMLEASGLPFNRITYLVFIRYFTRRNDLYGVRTILLKMKEQGIELGLDGINSCIWAYARNGRLDVASMIFRLLRHRVIPEDEVGEYDINAIAKQLAATEGFILPENIKPDATTYYTLIQCYAYHGDLIRCLQAFMEMIAMSNSVEGLSSGHRGAPLSEGSLTSPAFRAIFLGFARHGRSSSHFQKAGPLTRRLAPSAWTLINLEALFNSFINLPSDVRPGDRTIYWVLMAFYILTDRDRKKLRKVWEKLVERFGGGWGGRIERLRKYIYEES